MDSKTKTVTKSECDLQSSQELTQPNTVAAAVPVPMEVDAERGKQAPEDLEDPDATESDNDEDGEEEETEAVEKLSLQEFKEAQKRALAAFKRGALGNSGANGHSRGKRPKPYKSQSKSAPAAKRQKVTGGLGRPPVSEEKKGQKVSRTLGNSVKGREQKESTPRLAVKLAPTPTPYVTDAVRDSSFSLRLNDGCIYHWYDRDRDDMKETPFPTSIQVRGSPPNIKRLDPLKKMLTEGRTAKAFHYEERVSVARGYRTYQYLVLRFGRTPEEDLKHLPKYVEEQEEAARQKAASDKIRELEVMCGSWGNPPQDFVIEDVVKEMTPAARAEWERRDAEYMAGRNNLMTDYVRTCMFRGLMSAKPQK